jgi:hypothetical protein
MPKERRSRSPSFSLLPDDRSDQWGLRTGLLIGYRLDGEIDTTLGHDGYVEFRAPKPTEVGLSGMELLPDGKVLVGGELGGRFLLARLFSDGKPDRSFGGGDGRVLADVATATPFASARSPRAWRSPQSGKPLMLGLTGGHGRESAVSPVSTATAASTTASATYVSSFGSNGTENGQFTKPTGIARDSKGNLWVVDYWQPRVQKFNEAGEFKFSFGSTGAKN